MRAARRRRLLVQLFCLLAATVVLWPLLPWEAAPRFVVQTSPFVAIGSSVATRAVGFGTAIGLLLALPALRNRRWYCHYVCPTGFLLDRIARVGRKRTRWWRRWPPLGRHALLATLAGALVGYPVLLFLDPIAIFASPFATYLGGDLLSGLLAGALFAILLPLTFTSGMVWCVRLCPLGGLQDILIATGNRFTAAWRRFRQTAATEVSGARRAFLPGVIGLGLGLGGRRAGGARAGEAPLRPPGALAEDQFTGVCIRCGNCTAVCPSHIIRPDLGEAGLAGLLAPVIRYDRSEPCLPDCKACTQVCPSGALTALDLVTKSRYVIGEALVDTNRCLLTLNKKECDACVIACPYQAIRIAWDEDAYLAYPLVDYDRCNGCGACELACPTEQVKAIQVWAVLPADPENGRRVVLPKFLPASPLRD